MQIIVFHSIRCTVRFIIRFYKISEQNPLVCKHYEANLLKLQIRLFILHLKIDLFYHKFCKLFIGFKSHTDKELFLFGLRYIILVMIHHRCIFSTYFK